MASHIGAVREQNAIKIFSLPNRKISLCVPVFSFCAKWVKSCHNRENISTTWKKTSSFLSILDREKTISRYCPFNSSYSRKVSDSELEWLERDVTQMMDKDGPGAKTQTLFQVYHPSSFVFNRMGPVSGCLFRKLARSELKLNVLILASSCCESGIRDPVPFWPRIPDPE